MQKQGAIGALFFLQVAEFWQECRVCTRERTMDPYSVLTIVRGLGRQIPENPR